MGASPACNSRISSICTDMGSWMPPVQRLIHGMRFGGAVHTAAAAVEDQIHISAVIARLTAFLVLHRCHMAVAERERAALDQGIGKHQAKNAMCLDVRAVGEGARRLGAERQDDSPAVMPCQATW